MPIASLFRRRWASTSKLPIFPREHKPLWWGLAVALIGTLFLALKLYSLHPYVSDESTYLYQAFLLSRGYVPYREFSVAHPPMQMLANAPIFLFGDFNFVIGRLVAPFWCLIAGITLASIVRREVGALASLVSLATFLLCFGALRASSAATGANMATALTLLAYELQGRGWTRGAGVFGAAAVLTRLYVAPLILLLWFSVFLGDRRQARRLAVSGLVAGSVVLLATLLWAGWDPFVRDVIVYHVRKPTTDWGERWQVVARVIQHNGTLLSAWLVGAGLVIGREIARHPRFLHGTQESPDVPETTSRNSRASGLLPLAATVTMALAIAGSGRLTTHYFLPVLAFAAIVGAQTWQLLLGCAKNLLKQPAMNRVLLRAVAVLLLVAMGSWWLPRSVQTPLDASIIEDFRPPPNPLPNAVDAALRALFWKDARLPGDTGLGITEALWEDSKYITVFDEMVSLVRKHSSPSDTIFGDASTVPLIALVADRRIADNQTDTNYMRFTSGIVDEFVLVKAIDKPSTKLIILREGGGVYDLKALRRLIENRYQLLRKLYSRDQSTFLIYERKLR